MRLLCGVMGMLLVCTPLEAQGWVRVRGGWGYTADYATQGRLRCRPVTYRAGSCTTTADGVLLEHDGESALLQFIGESGRFTARSTGRTPVPLGTLAWSFPGGDGFTLPIPHGAVDRLFAVMIRMHVSGLSGDATRFGAAYYRTGPRSLALTKEAYASYHTWRLPPNPDPAVRFRLLAEATRDGRLSVNVSLIPEPASLVLLGTGLLGVLGLIRARRRRA